MPNALAVLDIVMLHRSRLTQMSRKSCSSNVAPIALEHCCVILLRLVPSRHREALMLPSASVPLCVTRVSALIPETSGATDIPFEQAPEWVTRVAALIPETSGVRDIPFELALRLKPDRKAVVTYPNSSHGLVMARYVRLNRSAAGDPQDFADSWCVVFPAKSCPRLLRWCWQAFSSAS